MSRRELSDARGSVVALRRSPMLRKERSRAPDYEAAQLQKRIDEHRRQLERRLAELERRYQHLYRHRRDGISSARVSRRVPALLLTVSTRASQRCLAILQWECLCAMSICMSFYQYPSRRVAGAAAGRARASVQGRDTRISFHEFFLPDITKLFLARYN